MSAQMPTTKEQTIATTLVDRQRSSSEHQHCRLDLGTAKNTRRHSHADRYIAAAAGGAISISIDRLSSPSIVNVVASIRFAAVGSGQRRRSDERTFDGGVSLEAAGVCRTARR